MMRTPGDTWWGSCPPAPHAEAELAWTWTAWSSSESSWWESWKKPPVHIYVSILCKLLGKLWSKFRVAGGWKISQRISHLVVHGIIVKMGGGGALIVLWIDPNLIKVFILPPGAVPQLWDYVCEQGHEQPGKFVFICQKFLCRYICLAVTSPLPRIVLGYLWISGSGWRQWWCLQTFNKNHQLYSSHCLTLSLRGENKKHWR